MTTLKIEIITISPVSSPSFLGGGGLLLSSLGESLLSSVPPEESYVAEIKVNFCFSNCSATIMTSKSPKLGPKSS